MPSLVHWAKYIRATFNYGNLGVSTCSSSFMGQNRSLLVQELDSHWST